MLVTETWNPIALAVVVPTSGNPPDVGHPTFVIGPTETKDGHPP